MQFRSFIHASSSGTAAATSSDVEIKVATICKQQQKPKSVNSFFYYNINFGINIFYWYN